MTKPLPGKEAQFKMAPYREMESVRYKNQSPPKTGCVMVLVYPVNKIPHLVLMKRADYNGRHSNQVSFPGGTHEEKDIHFEATALREAFEELNIDATKVNIIGQLTSLYIPVSNYNVYPFLAYANKRPDFSKDDKEVQEIIEIDLPHILSEDSIKEKMMTLSAGFDFNVPYFDIKNEVVWGATAMILSELKELLKNTAI